VIEKVSEWQFQNVVFDDGGTVTGHITVDLFRSPTSADVVTNVLAWDIETSAGHFPAFTYIGNIPGATNNSAEKFGGGASFSSPSESTFFKRSFGIAWVVPGDAHEFLPTFPIAVCQPQEINCVSIVPPPKSVIPKDNGAAETETNNPLKAQSTTE
jgi:hypothetical protein